MRSIIICCILLCTFGCKRTVKCSCDRVNYLDGVYQNSEVVIYDAHRTKGKFPQYSAVSPEDNCTQSSKHYINKYGESYTQNCIVIE